MQRFPSECIIAWESDSQIPHFFQAWLPLEKEKIGLDPLLHVQLSKLFFTQQNYYYKNCKVAVPPSVAVMAPHRRSKIDVPRTIPYHCSDVGSRHDACHPKVNFDRVDKHANAKVPRKGADCVYV